MSVPPIPSINISTRSRSDHSRPPSTMPYAIQISKHPNLPRTRRGTALATGTAPLRPRSREKVSCFVALSYRRTQQYQVVSYGATLTCTALLLTPYAILTKQKAPQLTANTTSRDSSAPLPQQAGNKNIVFCWSTETAVLLLLLNRTTGIKVYSINQEETPCSYLVVGGHPYVYCSSPPLQPELSHFVSTM